jgi:general secretion pathway protein J
MRKKNSLRCATACQCRGFTLVELLIAIALMALMAILSWRGLDGMARTQSILRERSDQVAALQTGLLQWQADLDAIAQTPHTVALDWDGRALRLTRHGTQGPGDGLRVVAWSRRTLANGVGWWLRWESLPVTTREQWQDAWNQAAAWAQSPGADARQHEVAIAPLLDWQVVYFRNNAWTNALSSAAGTAQATSNVPPDANAAAIGGVTPGAAAGTGVSPGFAAAAAPPELPDGVRLVLNLPPGRAIAGELVRDWVNPTVGGGKS